MWDDIDSDDEIFKSKKGKLDDKEFEEGMQYLGSHPLFMQKMPENIDNNPLL